LQSAHATIQKQAETRRSEVDLTRES